MVHLTGALLAASAAAWIGVRGAAALRERTGALRDLEAGLLLLEQELALDAPPLRLLTERLIPRVRGPARALFQACRAALDGLEAEELSAAWARAVGELDQLDEEARRCLLPLGESLGRCGWEDQRRTAGAVRERLTLLAARAEEESRRRGGLYRVLGLSGGAFLVILLL